MRYGLVAAAAALSAFAAAGKPAAPTIDPVAGAWQFETAVYKGSCRIRGEMAIRPTAKPNAYICSFVATETCDDLKVRADQSCTAVKAGNALTVTATVVKLSPPGISYAPDNWSLTIVDAAHMKGELRSADIAPVTFYRGLGAIS